MLYSYIHSYGMLWYNLMSTHCYSSDSPPESSRRLQATLFDGRIVSLHFNAQDLSSWPMRLAIVSLAGETEQKVMGFFPPTKRKDVRYGSLKHP